MRNLPICLRSPAQKVSDWVDGELGSLPLGPVGDDFELLDVEQKMHPTGYEVPFWLQSPDILLLRFFKNSFLRLFHSVGKVCCINTSDTISKD